MYFKVYEMTIHFQLLCKCLLGTELTGELYPGGLTLCKYGSWFKPQEPTSLNLMLEPEASRVAATKEGWTRSERR